MAYMSDKGLSTLMLSGPRIVYNEVVKRLLNVCLRTQNGVRG